MITRRSKSYIKLKVLFLILFLWATQINLGLAEESSVNSNTLSGGLIKRDGYYLPRALNIPVELRTPIDTRLSQRGDQVTVQVSEDIIINDYTIIPGQSFLHGYISKLERPGRLYKRPKLELEFDRLSMMETNQVKELNIKGVVRQKELMKKSSIVNFGIPYKTKAAAAATTGAAAAGGTGYAFVAIVEPYDTFGIANSLDSLTVAGIGLAGAAAGAALVKRDDVRMEPGTKLDVLLEEATYDDFTPDHTLSQHSIEDDSPELSLSEEYDRLSTMRAEELSGEAEAVDKSE